MILHKQNMTAADWDELLATYEGTGFYASEHFTRDLNRDCGRDILGKPITVAGAMSKPMRAKMRVASIEKTSYSEIVKFQAVYGGSTNAEDNTYASATPSGSITLQIDNKALHGVYQPEDTFYVDFTPVPKTP